MYMKAVAAIKLKQFCNRHEAPIRSIDRSEEPNLDLHLHCLESVRWHSTPRVMCCARDGNFPLRNIMVVFHRCIFFGRTKVSLWHIDVNWWKQISTLPEGTSNFYCSNRRPQNENAWRCRIWRSTVENIVWNRRKNASDQHFFQRGCMCWLLTTLIGTNSE